MSRTRAHRSTLRSSKLETLEKRSLMDGFGLVTPVPELSSKPDAPAAIYLDFDGHAETNWMGLGAPATTAGAIIGGALTGGIGSIGGIVGGILASELAGPPSTPVFSIDADRTTLNDEELRAIDEIYRYVAEDYAPFNLNVTTVDPGDFSNGKAIRISIGGNGDWYLPEAGGVAPLNGFSNDFDNSGFVFSEVLGGNARIAKSVSHEAGHLLGLEHKEDSTPTVWSLMQQGGLDRTMRAIWTNGNQQDDMAEIARQDNGFGYRADDHAGRIGSGTSLVFSSRCRVNNAPQDCFAGSGIIEQTSDTDFFTFTLDGPGLRPIEAAVEVGSAELRSLAAGGENPLLVDPSPFGNLDAVVELRNSTGAILATAAPSNSLGAKVTATVGPGQYYVVVRSQSGYGDVGQYRVSVRETSGPKVLAQHTSAEVDRIRVTFDKSVDPATFTAADVVLRDRNGVHAAVSDVQVVRNTQNRTWDIRFQPIPGGNGLELILGPTILDRYGNPMNQDNDQANGESSADQYRWRDFTGPRVTSSVPLWGQVRVSFNEPVLASSFTPSDVRLTDLNEVSIPVGIREVAGSHGQEYAITVAAFPSGGYRLRLGPNLTDLFGNAMNQDRDSTNGEPAADRFEQEHIDATAPTVTAVIPSRTMSFATVVFSEPVDINTFSLSDIQIVRQSTGQTVTVTSVIPVANSYGRSFQVLFAGNTGTYNVRVGPHVRDLFGNQMAGIYQGDFDMTPTAPLDLRGPIEVDPRLVDLAMQLFGTDPDDPIDPLLGIDALDLAVNPVWTGDMEPMFVDRLPFGARPIPLIG